MFFLSLQFYALYKQAERGPCNIAKPAFWDVVGKAKWYEPNCSADRVDNGCVEQEPSANHTSTWEGGPSVKPDCIGSVAIATTMGWRLIVIQLAQTAVVSK